MCYFLLESFHQNKFFLVEFRSQSTFSLATCAFLFNRCSCHVIKRFSCHAITSMLFNRCSSSRHPYHSQPHPLYCFLQMLYYLHAHFLTVVLLHSPEETRLSLYHNYKNVIVERIVKVTSTVKTFAIVIPIIIIHISALCSSCLNKKRNLWIITGNYSLIQAYIFINFLREYDFSELCFKFGKVYTHSTYKLNSKMAWSQLAYVTITIDIAR